MKGAINDLVIHNFKSIKKLHLTPKRINVYIGKPNVGKSNILEAVSLLGGVNDNTFGRPDGNRAHQKNVFADIVRYDKFRNLFYDNDRSQKLLIRTNLGYFFSRYHQNVIEQYDLLFGTSERTLNFFQQNHQDYAIGDLDVNFRRLIGEERKSNTQPNPYDVHAFYATVADNGQISYQGGNKENKFFGNIKRYIFKSDAWLADKNTNFLKPPFGENVFALLEANTRLFDEVAEIFDEYGLQALFDSETNRLEIQKVIGRKVYKIPYQLCADTLRRYIFNMLAIKTNTDSVLIMEEPESHSFPKYISEVAAEIVKDQINQYFIATHSPYLMKEFLDNCEPSQLAVYICGYKDYQTTARELTREEISNIKEEGVDLFYNLEAFND